MLPSKGYDGSWDLTVSVPRFDTTKTLKVKGDLHIGGLLLKLSELFQTREKEDWSDYAIWWPERNVWLLRTRSTLDQYGVHGSSALEFTQMHKELNFIVPDLRVVKLRTNFSASVFRVVIQACKKLDVRHPEELSISRKLHPNDLKRNQGVSAVRGTKVLGSGQDARKNSLFPNGNEMGGGGRSGSVTPEGTIERGLKASAGLLTPYDACGLSSTSMPKLDCELGIDHNLAKNPGISVSEAVETGLHCPRNHVEKARINAGWLDSSRSLMEHGIRESDTVLLRYKYYNFYDLSPRYDRVRINQIYQQMRWSLMSGECNCTEEEMLVFAALQVQVDQEMERRKDSLDTEDDDGEVRGGEVGVDDALDTLQMALDGSSATKQPNNIMTTPQLRDVLSYYRPKKMGFKSYKKGLFILKDVNLSIYNGESEAGQQPLIALTLKECEVSQNVILAKNEFVIKLLVNDSTESSKEIFIRLDSMENYAKWLVAVRLATKGRTMADSSYEDEVSSLRSIFELQRLSMNQKQDTNSNYKCPNIDPKSCIAPKFFKKMSTLEAKNRITSIHSHISEMKLKAAQMEYIRAWQLLPESGNAYFVIKFKDQKKEELLAISAEHLARLDLQTGEPLKTWSYPMVENWSVNWDTCHVELVINGQSYAFQCYTADCKVIHEFIGGYIFLMIRAPDKSQTLDEEYFQKLTGGRD